MRRRYIAVVGKADRASPPVETRITNINFNPTWTVPASIIRKDIIPKMQRDPGYLTRAKIRILDGRGGEINPRAVDWSSERAVNYTLRQDPGAGNSLGQVRIDMPKTLPSTCMTRRRSRSSRATTVSIPRAACASPTCATS